MSTLEELEYFCNEENSYGALLLTGAWGSGKTYLVDHDLSDKLQENAIIIRISLFGINSTEEIHKNVQREYIRSLAIDKFNLTGEQLNNIEKFTKTMTGMAKDIFGNDLTGSFKTEDYMPITVKINDKKVVLVFDDLERCNLEPTVILGCINEYCENKGIKTIVIANEEEMLAKVYEEKGVSNEDGQNLITQVTIDESELEYEDIKEKLFVRVVKQIPELSEIVPELINDYKAEDDIGYKDFLNDNKDCLLDVVSSSNVKNIRSIRFVLLNFERVYKKLIEKGVTEKPILKKYFQTFTAFALMLRDGKISKSEDYGSLLYDYIIEKDYPGYYVKRYMLPSVAKWLFSGEWNDNEVESDIDIVSAADRGLKPIDRMKMFPLLELEEDDIKEAFPEMLEQAYNGKLSLKELNVLFSDLCLAKRINYDLPDKVDLNKLNQGVDKTLQYLNNCIEEDNNIKDIQLISEEDLACLLQDERNIYDKIINFVKNKTELSLIYKEKLENALKSGKMSQLRECVKICCHDYDDYYVELLENFYKGLTNNERGEFLNIFRHIWKEPVTEDSIVGLQELQDRLDSLRKEEAEAGQAIRVYYTRQFIQIIDEMFKNIERGIL